MLSMYGTLVRSRCMAELRVSSFEVPAAFLTYTTSLSKGSMACRSEIATNPGTLEYEDEEAPGLSCEATKAMPNDVTDNGLAEKLAGLTVQEDHPSDASGNRSSPQASPAVEAASIPSNIPNAAERRPLLLPSPDLEGIASLIKAGKAKNIIVMCGAGISVSAGIPDFRSPGTGLYSQLKKYNLDRPEDVFDLDHFQTDPKPFCMLAKELFPGQFRPTPTHYFICLLHEKGLLLRCFSQNIDSLETQAGLPQDALVAAHGNFDTAHCISCGLEHPIAYFKGAVFKDKTCRCTECHKPVKPDIVFFGEDLPERFFDLAKRDLPKCDLLIVMGTSLVVHPFAGLITKVRPEVPRLLVNWEVVGHRMGTGGFDFAPETNRRDALHLGDCDDGARKIAALLGWQAELAALMDEGGRRDKRGSSRRTGCLEGLFGGS